MPTDEPQFLRDALRIFSQFATSIRCSNTDLAKERGAVLDVRIRPSQNFASDPLGRTPHHHAE